MSLLGKCHYEGYPETRKREKDCVLQEATSYESFWISIIPVLTKTRKSVLKYQTIRDTNVNFRPYSEKNLVYCMHMKTEQFVTFTFKP